MFYENKVGAFLRYRELNPLNYPLHLHQYIEILHVVRGGMEMQIGSELYSLAPGDIAIAFPNVPHSYHTLSLPGNTQLHILNCYVDLLPYHQKVLLEKVPSKPVLHPEDVHADILYAEQRLFELDIMDSVNVDLVGSLMSLYLSRMIPPLCLTDQPGTPSQDLTTEIITYIADHYTEDLSLDMLANHFGLGKYALSRIFSSVLKVNFAAYINTLRISNARHLLQSTNLSILAIAMECGYHNQQTFNRAFKERCGYTPREYREAPLVSDIGNMAV